MGRARIDRLRDSVVIISLYVDDKRQLPANEQREEEIAPGKTIMVESIGDKWSAYQAKNIKHFHPTVLQNVNS